MAEKAVVKKEENNAVAAFNPAMFEADASQGTDSVANTYAPPAACASQRGLAIAKVSGVLPPQMTVHWSVMRRGFLNLLRKRCVQALAEIGDNSLAFLVAGLRSLQGLLQTGNLQP